MEYTFTWVWYTSAQNALFQLTVHIAYNSKLYILKHGITQWRINIQCRDVRKSIIKQVLGKSWHLSSKLIKGIKINERWSVYKHKKKSIKAAQNLKWYHNSCENRGKNW